MRKWYWEDEVRKIVLILFSFIVWLLLTWTLNLQNIIVGGVVSITVGLIFGKLFVTAPLKIFQIRRWFWFILYIPVFTWEMAKANFDVAYRVITGKIRPGIVRISPKLTKDLSITMLANSITLTPGTLSVDIDETTNDLYIHWINVDENALKKKPVDCKYVCGNFPTWIRRIAE